MRSLPPDALAALVPHPALVLLAHLVWTERTELRAILRAVQPEEMPSAAAQRLFVLLREIRARSDGGVDVLSLRAEVLRRAPDLASVLDHALEMPLLVLRHYAP